MPKSNKRMGKTIYTAQCLIALCLLCLSPWGMAENTRNYAIWGPWQVDSVLSAWLIKRYVYPDAEFSLVAKGTVVSPERAIDTPNSPYRRNGMRTAFEETLRIHAIPNNHCIEKLRPIVRVIELAAWRKVEMPEAEHFEIELLHLLPKEVAKNGLSPAFSYIDKYCLLTEKK